jgi:hypothetical protein
MTKRGNLGTFTTLRALSVTTRMLTPGTLSSYLTPEPWRSHWTSTTWQEYLSAGETEARLAVIRQRTHTGRPLGTEDLIQDLGKVTQCRIALQKRGPRENIVTDRRQGELTFDPEKPLYPLSTSPV